MPMRCLLAFVSLVVSLAPAWAQDSHYAIRLSLDPATRVLQARMQVTLPANAAPQFGLGSGFALQALTIDGQAMDATAQSWPVPAGRPVEIAYRATLPALDAARASRALTPFADPEGSFLPLIGWHPGLAAGAFTYDVTIDVPAGQRAVAPGRMVEEREANGRSIVRFVFDKPARELTVFAGPYVVGETMHGPLRLRTYFPKEQAELGERYRRQVARYIDHFSATIALSTQRVSRGGEPAAGRLGFPRSPMSAGRSCIAVHAGAFARARGAACLVGPRRVGRLRARQLVGGLDHLHGRLCARRGRRRRAAREMRRRWLSDFAVCRACRINRSRPSGRAAMRLRR